MPGVEEGEGAVEDVEMATRQHTQTTRYQAGMELRRFIMPRLCIATMDVTREDRSIYNREGRKTKIERDDDV